MNTIVSQLIGILRSSLIVIGIDPAKFRKYFLSSDKSFDECDLVHAWLCKELDHPGLMIDVGVAWGSAAKPFLQNGWTVHGFEPDISESKAKRINELHAFKNFSLHVNAVSDTTGDVLDFYQSAESEGISSLHDFREHRVSHQVTTIALNHFFSESNINHVDFLKIDVEGHEKWVLNGLDFENVKPSVIVLEFDDHKTIPLGYTWQDLGTLLVNEGYFVFVCEWLPIVKYGSMHRFRCIASFPCPLEDARGWGNLIAVNGNLSKSFRIFTLAKLEKRFVRFSKT